MKAVIYARVSTERQAERGTIGSQVEALRAHVAAAGDELAGEYCDDGHSGARLDRPGLDQMRDAAEAGLFEVVWCLSPDRLARSYAYQVLILDELARFGVRVRFTDAPGLDQDDPQARLLTQVQGVIAEYERAKIGERYRRGKLFRARTGEVISWKAPYGYRRTPRGPGGPAHLEIFEPEAAVVRRIFTERAAGTTIRQICRQLNADAVPTPTGSRTVWGTSTLDRLLRNEAYIGRTYFNRTEAVPDRRPGHHSRQVPRPRADWIAIGCPAIIADEAFEAAGKVSTDNTKWSPRRAEPGAWLLRGLVKCGPCGVGTSCHKMRGRNGTWHRYYYCHNHDPLRAGGQDRRCPERNIRADALDEFVFGQIRAAVLDPGLLLAGEQAIAVHAPGPRRPAARRRTGPPGPQTRGRPRRAPPARRPLPGRADRHARTAAPRRRDHRTPARTRSQARQPRRRARRPRPRQPAPPRRRELRRPRPHRHRPARPRPAAATTATAHRRRPGHRLAHENPAAHPARRPARQ